MRLNIPVELVRRLIEDQFPQWADRKLEPLVPQGWDNLGYRLGDDLIVRMPSAACYIGQVDKEIAWLPKLRPHLPVAISELLVKGEPGHGYPWNWSINRWIQGRSLFAGQIADPVELGTKLGRFLTALQAIPCDDAPRPGSHNFHRGGALLHYDRETREALTMLGNSLVDDHGRRIDLDAITRLWQIALKTHWKKAPVLVHGDLSDRNLLIHEGELVAVIDFGMMAAGDPACDLAVAWTSLDEVGLAGFRQQQPHDPETWTRAKGWALWKALQTLRKEREAENPSELDQRPLLEARKTLRRTLSEMSETV